MKNKIFNTADILIPKEGLAEFSVVACDQYTSEPLYWEQVKTIAKGKPSAVNMVFPEIYLKTADFDKTVLDINSAIADYLTKDIFVQTNNACIYVERTLKNGNIRKGIMGVVDLECYDYSVGAQSAIRATEGTVLDRIPPRVKVRQDALLELPHVMLLIDDIDKSIIEPLALKKFKFKPAYDFKLMQDSGEIKGYFLDENSINAIDNGFLKLNDKDIFNKKYSVADKGVLSFAVGDGNHSLATAKKCYMNLKEKLGDEIALAHKARYALVEVVNLHDSSLEFEAIHRVVFDVESTDFMIELEKYYKISDTKLSNSQQITVVIGDTVKNVYITNPTLNLPVGSLQEFIDDYLLKNSGEVDYIHGEDVVKSLCVEHKNSIGFILESMDKNDLFKTVILDGALPRKTFSMGEACDKRFYLEARKITE